MLILGLGALIFLLIKYAGIILFAVLPFLGGCAILVYAKDSTTGTVGFIAGIILEIIIIAAVLASGY